MIITWHDKAEQDLSALVDFIYQDNPREALRIYYTIRKSVRQLARFPQSGRIGRVRQTRELIIPSLLYIVVYTIGIKQIQILAVFHTSRKWPKSFPTEL